MSHTRQGSNDLLGGEATRVLGRLLARGKGRVVWSWAVVAVGATYTARAVSFRDHPSSEPPFPCVPYQWSAAPAWPSCFNQQKL